jgi:MarR family transcriptional regulator, temperature-dependent positive regulator of motility
LKRLETVGFVRREIEPTDPRRHRLRLSPSGRRAAKDGLAVLSEEFNKRLGRLTAAQQKDLKNLLEKDPLNTAAVGVMRSPG